MYQEKGGLNYRGPIWNGDTLIEGLFIGGFLTGDILTESVGGLLTKDPLI